MIPLVLPGVHMTQRTSTVVQRGVEFATEDGILSVVKERLASNAGETRGFAMREEEESHLPQPSIVPINDMDGFHFSTTYFVVYQLPSVCRQEHPRVRDPSNYYMQPTKSEIHGSE